MAGRGLLAEIKALQRAQRHVLWLRANLPKHSITQRVERELLMRQTAVATAGGDTADSVIHTQLGTTINSKLHKRKERA